MSQHVEILVPHIEFAIGKNSHMQDELPRLSSFHKDSRQTWYATGRLLLVVRGKPGATDHAGTAAGLAQEPPTPRAYNTVLLLHSPRLWASGASALPATAL